MLVLYLTVGQKAPENLFFLHEITALFYIWSYNQDSYLTFFTQVDVDFSFPPIVEKTKEQFGDVSDKGQKKKLGELQNIYSSIWFGERKPCLK